MVGLNVASLIHFATAAAPCLGEDGCETGLPTPAASGAQLHTLLQVVFSIFGAIAVLMIVIASINFVNSEGDPKKAAKARDIIIYALVGLVISVSADIIVTFVLKGF